MHQRSTMKHPSHQLDKASRDHWAGTDTGRNHSEASVDGFAHVQTKHAVQQHPAPNPANCLKTCTLEIVWSKSKYTCFTNASGLTALATGTFGSTAMFSAAFAIFGVAAVSQTPLKPSGGGGGATLPLAAA